MRTRIHELIQLRNTSFETLVDTIRSTSREAAWVNQGCIDAWSYGGSIFRMVLSDLSDYLSLHPHLMSSHLKAKNYRKGS